MKALQLSSIALCLLGLFSSCTKDTLSSSSQDSLTSANSKTSVLGGNPNTPATPPGQGGTGGANNGNSSTDVTPALTVIYNPDPGVKGEEVIVTGTFDPNSTVAVPNCGKLQLQQWDGSDWVGLGSPVNVTATNHEVTYAFTPSVAGEDVYMFRVHYITAGCAGFNQALSVGFPLDVIEPCLPLALTGAITKTTPLGGNKYEFDVTYTVTSCPAMGAAHLQGGLTAVSGVPTLSSGDGTKGEMRNHTKNDNYILMWDFNISSGYSNTFTVTFTKEFKSAGAQEITGEWSVSAKNPQTGEEVKVIAPRVVFPG